MLQLKKFTIMVPYGEFAVPGARSSNSKEGGNDETERHALALFAACPADIEELTEKSGLPVSELHGLLLGLELKGLIRQLPGQQYERTA